MNVAWPELILGAAAMFVLDPRAGAGRRAAFLCGTWYAARWLASGPRRGIRRLAAVRRRGTAGSGSDAELAQRIRQAIGDVSEAEGIRVQIEARRVTLSGPILAREVVRLLRQVAKVPGVVAVNNRLRVRRMPRPGTPRVTESPAQLLSGRKVS